MITRSNGAPDPLPAPPVYLAEAPTSALLARQDSSFDPERLLGWLRNRGIYARPSRAEVEAERARRGARRLAVGDAPASSAPARLVLPMIGEYGPTPDGLREEARRNRAQIDAALGDLAGHPGHVTRIASQIAREEREDVA